MKKVLSDYFPATFEHFMEDSSSAVLVPAALRADSTEFSR